MAICQKCGEEYTPNIWGELGGLVGTPRLCEEHSSEWLVYYAAAKVTGMAVSAILGYFLAGLPVGEILDMVNKKD
jgi:hypothetical protein